MTTPAKVDLALYRITALLERTWENAMFDDGPSDTAKLNILNQIQGCIDRALRTPSETAHDGARP